MSGRSVTNSGKSDSGPEMDVPAVAYVRMSTDHQKYSTENQLDVIRSYARARGLQILRVFEDAGRSGLRLDGREALQNLMAEVQSGRADFKAILVDLPPGRPSFITRVWFVDSRRFRFGQARRARSPQIAQAPGALLPGSCSRAKNAA